MFTRTFPVLPVSLVILFLAAGCSSVASHARIESDEVNPAFKGGKGEKVLVVVASPDPALREDVESQFAIAAYDYKMSMTPSHRVLPSFKDVTKESLMELVKRDGYDRVILARTVPGSASTGRHTDYSNYYSVVGAGFDPWMGMYDSWSSTYTTIYSPTDPPPSFGSYIRGLTVETLLFDASDATLIWKSTTSLTSSEQVGETAMIYAGKIVGRLRQKGLL